MPRPGQTRIAIPLSVTLPPDIHAAFVKEAGEGYGSRSTLFRKMWSAYLTTQQTEDFSLSRRYLDSQARVRSLERRLAMIRAALSKESLM